MVIFGLLEVSLVYAHLTFSVSFGGPASHVNYGGILFSFPNNLLYRALWDVQGSVIFFKPSLIWTLDFISDMYRKSCYTEQVYWNNWQMKLNYVAAEDNSWGFKSKKSNTYAQNTFIFLFYYC